MARRRFADSKSASNRSESGSAPAWGEAPSVGNESYTMRGNNPPVESEGESEAEAEAAAE